jgi:hypothetical protein
MDRRRLRSAGDKFDASVVESKTMKQTAEKKKESMAVLAGTSSEGGRREATVMGSTQIYLDEPISFV